MFLDDVAGRLTTNAAADSDRAIGQLNLDHHRAERIDAPTGSLRLVLFIDGHWIGNRQIDDPMIALLVVIVGAHFTGRDHIRTHFAEFLLAS